MTIEKHARSTLTAFELDHGDECRFRLTNGTVRSIRLVRTRAMIDATSRPYQPPPADVPIESVPPQRLTPRYDAQMVLRMHCTIEIDGTPVELVRWVGNQRSFYRPWELAGLRIWFDAADALFGYLNENHGACRPRKHARFAVQDARLGICPVLLHAWCPLPEGGLRIQDAYAGSDCWMGPYAGADAHGGLDINHPAGTPIWAPVNLDEHGLFDSVADGAANNRWRGVMRWADGSTWVLQVHHVIGVHPEAGPVAAGTHIADGAGVSVGAYEHSHFVFKVIEPGMGHDDAILLDPWILFWQMYRDRERTTA